MKITAEDLNALREVKTALWGLAPSATGLDQWHIEALESACAVLCHERDPDPMHERVAAEIERLGLDGSRFELAVAIFGWGSDEANGSLLGLVRMAWGDGYAVVMYDGHTGWRLVGSFDYPGLYRFKSEVDALVAALEAAPCTEAPT